MPENIVSDPDLLARLRAGAPHPITAEEINQQRVSFVYGNLPEGSTITRDQVEARLATMEGVTV